MCALPSPYLSRHHAVIVGTPEGYYLVDLNSVNGVLLNGRRIERTVLCDEDVLTVGPFRLKVQVPEWLTHDGALPRGRVARRHGRHAAAHPRKLSRLAREIDRAERAQDGDRARSQARPP